VFITGLKARLLGRAGSAGKNLNAIRECGGPVVRPLDAAIRIGALQPRTRVLELVSHVFYAHALSRYSQTQVLPGYLTDRP